MKQRLFCIGLMFIILLSLSGCTHYQGDDISQYGLFLDSDFVMRSPLDAFPKELSESCTVNEYYFSYQDSLLDAHVQIYLDCTYSKEEYQSEAERILSLDGKWEGLDQYHYPAFEIPSRNMSGHDMDLFHQYCLFLLDEHRIIYIYLEFTPREDVCFAEEFLPLQYRGTY